MTKRVACTSTLYLFFFASLADFLSTETIEKSVCETLPRTLSEPGVVRIQPLYCHSSMSTYVGVQTVKCAQITVKAFLVQTLGFIM